MVAVGGADAGVVPVAGDFDLTGGFRFAHFGPGGSVRALVVMDDRYAKRYEVHVTDPVAGRAVASPLTHADTVLHAAFSPDGKRVVTASEDKTAAVWDAATGERVAGPLRHADGVRHAAFSPDGRRVVTASGDKTATVWDAATGEKLAGPLKHAGFVWHAAFSPDGRRVVTAGDKIAAVWDVATGEKLGSVTVK